MTTVNRIFYLVLFLFVFSSISSAQLVVVKKPVRSKVVLVNPAKPGKNHIWIDGHWKASGAKYVWVQGKWAKNRPGHHWIKGHWKKTRAGWIWIPGHWK